MSTPSLPDVSRAPQRGCGQPTAEPTPLPSVEYAAAVRAALRLPCLRVADIAAAIGVPRATLEAYRLGTRRMPHVTRARLTAFLTAYAADVLRASAALTSPPGAAVGDDLRADPP